MRQVRMKTGPNRGQVVTVFDHEVGSLVASGFADELHDEATSPASGDDTPAPSAKKPAAKKTSRKKA